MECIFLNIRFARVCSHVNGFNARNKCPMLNFSNRVIGFISLERLFSSSIAHTMHLFQNSMSDIKKFTSRPIEEPERYGDFGVILT